MSTMAASTTFVRPLTRPGVRFLLGHPEHIVALSFGAGLIPVAPGTFGTLLALPLFAALAPRLSAGDFLIVLGFAFVAGVSICDKAGRDLGIDDDKSIVWDETVAFLLVLFFTP